MASIIQAAHRHQDVIHNLAATVKKKTYTPTADFMLKGLKKSEKALGAPIARMANRTFEPVRGTGSFLKSAKNVAINYDVAISKAGEAASRYAGAGTYYLVHKALTFISGSKAGRVVQEGVAQALGFLVRGIGLLVTTFLRALPYLAIAAGLAFGGWKIGLALAALFVVSKVGFAFTLTGIALGGILTAQQVQIHRIGSKLSDAFKRLRGKDSTIQNLQDRLNEGFFSKVGEKLKAAADAVAKRKMALTGVLLGGLGIGAYYMFPEQATQMTDFVSSTASGAYDTAAPYVSGAYDSVCDITSQVAQNEYVAPVVSFVQTHGQKLVEMVVGKKGAPVSDTMFIASKADSVGMCLAQ